MEVNDIDPNMPTKNVKERSSSISDTCSFKFNY